MSIMKEQQDHPHALRWFYVLFMLLNFPVFFLLKSKTNNTQKKPGKITNKCKFSFVLSLRNGLAQGAKNYQENRKKFFFFWTRVKWCNGFDSRFMIIIYSNFSFHVLHVLDIKLANFLFVGPVKNRWPWMAVNWQLKRGKSSTIFPIEILCKWLWIHS